MIANANVVGQTDSSLNISVDYTGENSEHIGYVIYIDTSVISDEISSCSDESNKDNEPNVQCVRTPQFIVNELQDGTLHNLIIYTWLDGLRSEKAFLVHAYTSEYFMTNNHFRF